MGLFTSPRHPVRFFGWDPRAAGLPGEEIGILMEMEQQILASQRRESLIQQCAEGLLAGDRDWVAPIRHKPHEYARDIEHAAIAEAFKRMGK